MKGSPPPPASRVISLHISPLFLLAGAVPSPPGVTARLPELSRGWRVPWASHLCGREPCLGDGGAAALPQLALRGIYRLHSHCFHYLPASPVR